MREKRKYWLSFIDGAEFKGDDPAFFDRAVIPGLSHVEQNYEVIKEELLNLVKDESNLIPYFNKTLTEKLTWKIFPLMMWEKEFTENIKKCPKTFAILKSCPELLSASFSVLEPGTDIKPHYGDSNVMYRCHLGLVIPAGLPECGMEVNKQQISWEQGKVFAFCDAHYHRAWNRTKSKRLVLIYDLLRPEFKDKKKEIVTKVRMSLFWLHLAQSSFIISKVPFFIKRMLVNIPATVIGLFRK